MTHEQFQQLNDKLNVIDKKVAVIESRTEEWCETLFGNGQPGVIEKLSGRITKLERYLWLGLGGMTVITWIFK